MWTYCMDKMPEEGQIVLGLIRVWEPSNSPANYFTINTVRLENGTFLNRKRVICNVLKWMLIPEDCPDLWEGLYYKGED